MMDQTKSTRVRMTWDGGGVIDRELDDCDREDDDPAELSEVLL